MGSNILLFQRKNNLILTIYRNIYNNIVSGRRRERSSVYSSLSRNPMNQSVNIKQLVSTGNPSELASQTDSHVCID